MTESLQEFRCLSDEYRSAVHRGNRLIPIMRTHTQHRLHFTDDCVLFMWWWSSSCGKSNCTLHIFTRITPVHPLPSNRQHLSYDVCLEVRGWWDVKPYSINQSITPVHVLSLLLSVVLIDAVDYGVFWVLKHPPPELKYVLNYSYRIFFQGGEAIK